MFTPLSALLFGVVALASPLVEVRTVSSLNQAAFEEAQQRDATATRAFSSTAIKTSDGKCLLVDELSGDFRANLTPVRVAACDGSAGQQWDIITAGKHDDQAGTMLVVSSLVSEAPITSSFTNFCRPKLALTSILAARQETQSFYSHVVDEQTAVVPSPILNFSALVVARDLCPSSP